MNSLMLSNFFLGPQVGPITVTSANPTGEADTTHHNQVYAKLGDKVNSRQLLFLTAVPVLMILKGASWTFSPVHWY